MSAFRHDSVLLSLIKRVDYIQSILRKVTVNLPLFDIANENTPDQLTADQNNYVIGNYDILRISSDKDVTITGLKGGIKGRSLRIFNVGNFRLIFAHANASSDPENRFDIVGGEDIEIFPSGNISLYYDSTLSRWVVPQIPSWFGVFGLTTYASAAIQNIASGGDQQVTNWTIERDDFDMFDTVNSKIIIPVSGLYLGVFSGNFDANATGYRKWAWEVFGFFPSVQTVPAVTTGGIGTSFGCPFFYPLDEGDEIRMYVGQNSGSPLNINNVLVGLTRVF